MVCSVVSVKVCRFAVVCCLQYGYLPSHSIIVHSNLFFGNKKQKAR